jgi:predicted  nucleic acid-binding Zn-ribbon protein
MKLKPGLWMFTGTCAMILFSLAAYFSVYGFSYFLSGIKTQAIILAIGLELSKIALITYMYNWSKETSKKIKTYIYTAIVFLMIFTSGSIYGFLASGYQKTSDTVSNVTTELSLKQEEQKTIQDTVQMERNQLEIYKKRLNTVNDTRNAQEERLTEVTKTLNWKQINSMKADITKADKELEELNIKITNSIAKIGAGEKSLKELRESKVTTEKSLKGIEIGTYRFLMKVFNTSMDKIANGIFLWLIFIFDPLAVVLMLITNKQIAKQRTPVEQGTAITPQYVTPIPESKEDKPKKREELKQEIKNLVEQYKMLEGEINNGGNK